MSSESKDSPEPARGQRARPIDLRAQSAGVVAILAVDAGLWPVAIHPYDSKATKSPGKAPIGSSWGAKRPDTMTLRSTFHRHPKAGVGLLLGSQGGVIDIDVDDPEAAGPTLGRLFPDGLPPTLRWENAKGRVHLLFQYDSRLAKLGKTIVKGVVRPDGEVAGNPHYLGLEVRIGAPPDAPKQLQSVIPPSFMTNGEARRWVVWDQLLPLPESVILDLERFAVDAPKATPAPVVVPFLNPSTIEQRAIKYLAKCEPAIETQDGSGRCFKAAAKMVEFGLDEETAYRLLMAEYNPRCQPPWSEAEMRHKVQDAFRVNADRAGIKLRESKAAQRPGGKPPAPTPPAPAPPSGPIRPEIEVNTQRHEVLDRTLEALTIDPDIYRRGPFLVRVVWEGRDEARLTPRSVIKGVAGSPKIIALADAVIGTRLTKFADFYAWKKGKGGEDHAVSAHPPDWLIKAVATLEHWPKIRRLMAVVECPFPRPDGSVVESPGYDAETSTLYLPAARFPAVPKAPTRDDARKAWARLATIVRQFPFDTEDDRVVFLAGMLNVIGRPAIEGPVMGVAVVGNRASTGKGLLIDAMTIPGIGRPAPTTTYPYEKEEANKVKVAIVLSGKPVVSFDNLDEGTSYGGGVMDSALTAYTIDERILGASKNTGDLEVRTTWFLNGNNISPTKDAYRRWMVCNLVTDLESPEDRDDIEDKNLRKVILERRGQVVRDALTILKAHALAGWPTAGWAAKGSFEDWDRVVRGAVWFATGRDCLATQKRAAQESPERRDKLALLEGWRELPGGSTGLTTTEAVKLVEAAPAKFPTLWEVMSRTGHAGKPMTSRQLGNRFRGLKNNRLDGLTLREAGERNGSTLWAVGSEGQGPGDGISGCTGCLQDPPTQKNTTHSDIKSIQKTYEKRPDSDPVQPEIPSRGGQMVIDPDDLINAPNFRI